VRLVRAHQLVGLLARLEMAVDRLEPSLREEGQSPLPPPPAPAPVDVDRDAGRPHLSERSLDDHALVDHRPHALRPCCDPSKEEGPHQSRHEHGEEVSSHASPFPPCASPCRPPVSGADIAKYAAKYAGGPR